jgi:hypothetical protein
MNDVQHVYLNIRVHVCKGVDKFSRHSPNWRVVKNIPSPSQKITGPIFRNCQLEGKKLARLASEFVFLLANPEFYSYLASWQVVIRTPDVCETNYKMKYIIINVETQQNQTNTGHIQVNKTQRRLTNS